MKDIMFEVTEEQTQTLHLAAMLMTSTSMGVYCIPIVCKEATLEKGTLW